MWKYSSRDTSKKIANFAIVFRAIYKKIKIQYKHEHKNIYYGITLEDIKQENE